MIGKAGKWLLIVGVASGILGYILTATLGGLDPTSGSGVSAGDSVAVAFNFISDCGCIFGVILLSVAGTMIRECIADERA